MKIVYNYITTNKVNGKQYVGMHSTDNVDDGYLGTGLLILKAINKYGKENFTREILWKCVDLQEAFSNEAIYIKKYNTLSPNGYNISPTGGLGVPGCFSDETKLKISKARKGKKQSEETIRKRVEKNKGQKRSDEVKRKMGLIHKGLKHSDESKRKISKTKKEQKLIAWNKGQKRSDEVKRKISENRKGGTSWNKGIPCSEETKRKISETKKKIRII